MKKFKGKKGSVIYLFFAVIIFLIVWGIALAPIIGEWGAKGVEDNNLTGLEAFFFGNINLVIFLVLLLVIIAVVYAGGGV